MDKQGSGLIVTLRSFFMFFWVIATILPYAGVCMVTGLFSRSLTQAIGRNWMIIFLRLAGVTLSVSGAGKLDKKECYIFFPNHSSLVDIPVLYAAIANPLVFIAKKELFWFPLFGWGMYGMGHVSIDRSSPRKALTSFKKAIVRVKREHLSPVLFPEGTRSVDGKLGEFRQGSFSLAIGAGIKVVPIAIRNTRECLPKKKLFVRSGSVTVSIGDPISIEGLDKPAVMAKVREEIEGMLKRN